ncbi:diacylglycerol kinase family protein [uncultured Sphingosinicella sp.]|jgi:diacylglycerol kinase family enzyme|uniref:diacylglycerol/lipid kinase family protein n=1 Tax=uncultured Sphingosinicella sp. TaxID=478748 RepID=UPI0030DA3A3E|tara:strand:- start:58183 stop:59154 length:972 start_codon:yes stop_codon:yes gene_type:complete
MACVALLSNPRSTGNKSVLPRIREFVAQHPNIFHYEVGDISEVPDALAMIARVKPAVLVINGGDGTVQAALTEIYNGHHFKGAVPPLAVLPNGKTNLIALDLGAGANPVEALSNILKIVETGVDPHVVARQLIALSDGIAARPVFGMFLGGAGLAEAILFCRNKIYPLGLPNWVSHLIATIVVIASVLVGAGARWNPVRPSPMRVSLQRDGVPVEGSFLVLMVTTLERLLLNFATPFSDRAGPLKLMAIEQRRATVLKALVSALAGRLGSARFNGLHLRRGDEIRIEGKRASVILDGELYEAGEGHSIVLTPTAPVSFLNLAA